MTRQYGENGFMPTVANVREVGGLTILETIDDRKDTDLICSDGLPGAGLTRRGDLKTEKQKELESLER